MNKFGRRAKNTIALTLVLTFAFMFVPIQNVMYAKENLQEIPETENNGYLEDYTEKYGWDSVEGIEPLIPKNSKARRAKSANAKATVTNYLAILIEFPDADMQNIHLDDELTLKAADMVMNSGGINRLYGGVEIPVVSLKQYLQRYSYGTYSTQTSFFPKNDAGTVVSYVSAKPRTYYMKKTANNPDGYAPGQQGIREAELLEEVLQAVKPSIEKELNGADLDANNDGFIDAISFMVEGKRLEAGGAFGWGDLLWSHKAEKSFNTRIAGKSVGAYNLNNVGEPQHTMGGGVFSYMGNTADTLKLSRANYSVIHHEFLHTLGLPDLYRGYATGSPVGFYDIMANNNGQNPQAMLSILSRDWLSWGNKIPEITADQQITIQKPNYINSNETVSYKIYSPLNDKEYFIVEYYQNQDTIQNPNRNNGFIVYRVNAGTGSTNIDGTTDGLKDYLFVFRPGETTLGAAAGDLENAIVLPTVGNVYGKTTDESGNTWDKDTIYYSNGSNSGIKLEVAASDADSITLNVTVPQVQGTGTQNDPYLISSMEDWNALLAGRRIDRTKYFKLMKDIDFANSAVTPVGSFMGSLDGNGKTLSNITINSSGLFENIGGGSIKNLTISNIQVTGAAGGHAGGFAETISGGIIENIALTSGTVIGGTNPNSVGGFVGYLGEGATIRDCYSSLEVSNGQNVGGFIGITTGGNVENCFANGKVQKSGGSSSGGFYGTLLSFGGIVPTFTGCAYDIGATGHTTADNKGDIAGITGYQASETITLDLGGANEANIQVETKPVLQSLSLNIRFGSTAIANFNNNTQKLYGVSVGNTTLYIDVVVGTHQMPLTTQIQVTDTSTPAKPITGVTITPNTLRLEKGTTSTLTANITPADATGNKTITWSSDNEAVATVDANGQVTAKGGGTAIITATTSNGLTSTCTVTVTSAITGVTITPSTLQLEKGTTSTLTANITPADATDNKTITWSSDNEAVATVDANGQVTAKSVGTATITAATVNGFTSTCTVTVTSAITGVTITPSTLQLEKGDTSTLTANITPADATGNKTITWSSNNEAVATVDANGQVTAKGGGTAIITATTSNGLTSTCTVTVTSAITGVTITPSTLQLEKGDTSTLTANITPADATGNKTITWSSDNEAVATVDANGQVTAKSVGTATITATTSNGLKNTCIIKVEEKVAVQPVIADGYYEIRSAVSGKNLEVYGVSHAGGAKITQWYATGGRNQKWKVENQGDGTVRLTNVESGLVLDYNASINQYEQWDWHGRANQRWQISSAQNGNYFIQSASNGHAVDLLYGNMGNGQHVVDFEFNGGENQQWQFIPTDPAATQVAPDGYYEIKSAVSGKNLEIYGASLFGGGKLTQWDATGGSNQKWKLENQSDGTVRLTNVGSGLVLDYNASMNEYEQWDWHGRANQRWQISKSNEGNYYIRNASNEHAMDLLDGNMNNGQYVVDSEFNGGENQQWQLVPTKVEDVISDGYYEIKSAVSGKNLEIYGASLFGGGKLTQWDSTGGNNQKWKVENQGDGTVRLTNVESGLVLDYNGSINQYEQWDWHGRANQRWQISRAQNGNYYIKNASNGHAVDLLYGNMGNGQHVVDFEFNGGANQQWQFIRV